MNTTCIMCPMGCPLTVEEREGKILVSGNGCPRGEKYGAAEYARPERVVTTLVKGERGGVVSVKTDAPIPKSLIGEALKDAARFRLRGRVRTGEIVMEDVAGSGVNFVATADFDGR